MTQPNPPRRFSLSEDWLATIIGLVIVAIVGLGLLGPGPQSVTLTAKPGETVEKTARPLSGWKASATIGGEKITVADAPRQLSDGQQYPFTCADGTIAAEAGDLTASFPSGAHLVLTNNCAAEATITYTTSTAVRWPLFGIFK
ncbi:MAG: hypothetical protein HZC41_26860 [Chloroflexi bacterium]|nr:hypothetical protein [Chloroflexota bacterium]